MEPNFNSVFSEAPREGRHPSSASTAASDRSVSPSNRTASTALDKERTASSTLDKGRTAPTLDKERTASSDLDHHPYLQAVRTAAHNAKEKLHLDSIHATGPSDLFNPTNVRVHIRWRGNSKDQQADGTARPEDERYMLWRSRDNRKRRNSSFVPAIAERKPIKTRLYLQFKETSLILWQMFTTFPYWDMAFWSGWSYTWGSVLFVMDGAWAFMEVASPGSVSHSVAVYGGPMCFFIGALLYQVGATVAYLEAVNDGSFRGSAMRRFLEGHENQSKQLVNDKIHSFLTHFTSHAHDEEKQAAPRRGAVDLGPAEEGTQVTYNTWRWWPSWHYLKTHHVYEIGYLACAIQLFGATLYGVCGVVNLPGILTSLEPWQKEAAYWIPQIVASCCFLSAGIMFTLETQEKWNKPEPATIGWWIGIWATIGSVGFLLIACFGAAEYDVEWGEYQASLTSIWGAAAYLISGFLQWYEATDKRAANELLNDTEDSQPIWAYPMPMLRREKQEAQQDED